MSINRLSDFGYNFQVKLIISLLTNVKFLQQVVDILEESFFESEANSLIIQIIKDYFFEFKTLPTPEVLSVKVKELDDEILRESVKDTLKTAFKHVNDDDLIFVQEKTLEFCKNQALKAAINESIDLLEQGNYEAIKIKIDSALKAGMDKDIGHDYKKDIELRYSEIARNVIATDWHVINDLLDGGLGKGELGIIVGGPGSGKTWTLTALGAAALKKGLRVCHYSLELSEEYMGIRYDSLFTGIPSQNLKYNLDEVRHRVEQLPGDLIIADYPARTASVNTLTAHYERLKVLGRIPALVIVDYGDLLKGIGVTRNLRTDEILGDIYTDLRTFAAEQSIPVWTASQTQRSAASEDIIEGHKIAASYEKIMIGDFIVSISRKVEDKIAGTGRWHIIKNRFGPDGITFPSKINMSNGKIDIFEAHTIEGQQAEEKMTNEVTRKYLSQRHKDLFKKETEE